MKTPATILTKKFNDNKDGAIAALSELTGGKYVGTKATPDRVVKGVWEVVGTKPKFRAIVYLASYEESDGTPRKFNDFEMENYVSESAMQSDINPDKKIVISGVKGMKSASFKKTFKNMAAYDKWLDSEEAGNFEVQYIQNESLTIRESMNDITSTYADMLKK